MVSAKVVDLHHNHPILCLVSSVTSQLHGNSLIAISQVVPLVCLHLLGGATIMQVLYVLVCCFTVLFFNLVPTQSLSFFLSDPAVAKQLR